MTLVGAAVNHGIGTTTGTAITYRLEKKYRLFACRAGIPAAMLPASRVRFIVMLDGKEAYRSAERTSVDDALNIVVPVGGVDMMTIKVETGGKDAPGPAIWADPVLLKAEGR